MLPEVEEFLREPRALVVIAEMAAQHPTPFSFRQFADASGYFPETAGKLRDKMESWNVLTVADVGRRQEIRLTQYGLEINDQRALIVKILERALRAKSRTPTS